MMKACIIGQGQKVSGYEAQEKTEGIHQGLDLFSPFIGFGMGIGGILAWIDSKFIGKVI